MTPKIQNMILFVLILFGMFVVGAGFGTFMANRKMENLGAKAYDAGVRQGIKVGVAEVIGKMKAEEIVAAQYRTEAIERYEKINTKEGK